MASDGSNKIGWEQIDAPKFIMLNVVLHAFSDSLLYPPDTVRTRMQTQNDAPHASNKNPTYRNSWHCFTHILEHEGVKGLYKGFTMAITSYVLSNAFHYAGYEYVKEKFGGFQRSTLGSAKGQTQAADDTMSATFVNAFVSGALTDLTAMPVVVPVDVVQQRLQLQGPYKPAAYRGAVHAVRRIYGEEGLRGLYRGTGATVLGYVPAAAIWWSVYEVSKDLIYSRWMSPAVRARHASGTARVLSEDDIFTQASASAAASTVTRTLMNPLDVAKTRLQTQDMEPLQPGQERPRTTWRMLRHMMRTEGLPALWKGLAPSLVTAVPSTALSVLFYEWAKLASVKPRQPATSDGSNS